MTWYQYNAKGNRKTGIPTTTSGADTCPPSCGQFQACYAKRHWLGKHWQNLTKGVTNNKLTWNQLLAIIRAMPAGTLWRHNQAGDLGGQGEFLDTKQSTELAQAAAHTRGFTYTHKWKGRLGFISRMYRQHGFLINVSCDTLEQADTAMATGAMATVVLPKHDPPAHTPKGRRIVICPAQTHDNVTCGTCQLCARQREVVIGFLKH